MPRKPQHESADKKTPLKKGWTTGACATAATKAAYTALLTAQFPDPVTIKLPRGQQPTFALALKESGEGFARAGIVKDAGDDPDVTHGATIVVTVRETRGEGRVVFKAGAGVGMVTKPGLPIPPGEAAINPVPRQMMQQVIQQLTEQYKEPGGKSASVEIEISIPGGREIAKNTWNGRLGIEGGLSILGTTGIVTPYSCSAWIHSIHRGIDVARATGRQHVAGCTGTTSEQAVQAYYGLADTDMLDMGDFAGGMLKYLKKNPVPHVTIGGGFGKLTKLAQGHLDLHSKRSQVDFEKLAGWVAGLVDDGALIESVRNANTANQVLTECLEQQVPIASLVAHFAAANARKVLTKATKLDVVIVDRQGQIVAT